MHITFLDWIPFICSALGMFHELESGMPSAASRGGAIELNDAELRERMSGNLCRCGAYVGIREAIHQAYEAAKS